MAWLAGYSKRKKITVASAQVSALLTDFPVYLPIVADADIGAVCRADGYDLRLTQSDGETLLKYERLGWTVAAGEASGRIWTKAPSISSVVDTDFYLYYGDAGAGDGEDAANVWDSDHQIVWHLGESSGDALDSTGNGRDGTYAGNLPDQRSALCGNGQHFDGTGDYVTRVSDAGLVPSTGMTWSGWFNLDDLDGWAGLGGKGQWAGGDSWYLALRNSDNGQLDLTTSSTHHYGNAGDMGTGSWQHVCVRATGSDAVSWDMDVRVDDAEKISFNTSVDLDSSHAVVVAAQANGSEPIAGFVDEFRYSTTYRSDAWVTAEKINQGTPLTFLTIGAEEDLGGGGAAVQFRPATPAAAYPSIWGEG